MKAYKQLEKHFGDITALEQVSSILGWDKDVMLPEEGTALRGRQSSVLAVKIHEMNSDPKIGEWLAAVNREELDEWQCANLRHIERSYVRATAVPADLIEKWTTQSIRTESVWRSAKKENDFKMVAPDLAALLGIVREVAEAKAEKLKTDAYAALVNDYAPDMPVSEIDAVFTDLAAFLPEFIGKVLAHQKKPLPIKGPFPVEIQQKFGRELAEALGFSFTWGRLDVSAHPFSTGIGGDVRITTRYDENEFMQAMQGITHEVGHGFFDRHTPSAWWGQPLGATHNMGMAIHESQSLSLDMQLGRSRAYWEFFSPRLQAAYGRSGPEWSGDNLYRLATQVERGFIRVDADEVTYPAHIILRYRLERAMVEGKLDVKDLPEAWNAQMQELIGAVPPNDRLGCLQDIHWYGGSFGYFPAYALGAMIAAQMVDKMKRDIPDMAEDVRKGNFGTFTGWLRDNVQRWGCLYTAPELIEKATGAPFSAHAFKKHLTERYLEKPYEGKDTCSTTSAQEGKRRA